jgi:hypothetical protein
LARQQPEFSLQNHTAQAGGEPEALLTEADFNNAISKNLRRGRCLLLIVGDGMTEKVEAMV